MSALLSDLVAPASPTVSAQPCLIVNPLSFRASKGGLAARATALARRYGAEVIQASEPAQLHVVLEMLRRRRQTVIFVLSGDGTVQAIVQYLALLPAGAWAPQLLLFGGGRTNMTARNFGGRGAVRDFESALRRCRDGRAFEVQDHRLLRIEQEGAPAQHGFFLAAAMIDSGIRLCRQHRRAGRGWLHDSVVSDPYCLIKLAVRVMLGRSTLPPYSQLRIATDTGDLLSGPSRVLLATTLSHRHGLYNPYAERGPGAIRVTAVTAAATRFWRRLPGLLTGHFTPEMNLQDGYLSGSYDCIEVMGLGGYSLDGETFDTDPARPVLIRGGPHLRILQP